MSSPAVYETLLTKNRKLVAAEAHWKRLAESSKLAGIEISWPDVLSAVEARLSESPVSPVFGRLRVLLQVELPPRVDWEQIPDAFAPATAIWSRQVRDELTPLSRAKLWQQTENLLAAAEAAAASADEAILLNSRGEVAEGYRSNVFAVIDGIAFTPPLSSGALPGTVRAELLALRPDLVKERALRPRDLSNAEELFFTSAIRLVQPVRHLADQDFSVFGNVSATLMAVLAERRG